MSSTQQLIVSKNALQNIDQQSIVIRADAQKVRLAAQFTGKGDIRMHMNYVHIEAATDAGAICIACDGFKVILIHDPEGRAESSAVIPLGLGNLPAELKSPNALCVDRDGMVFIQSELFETLWVSPTAVLEDMKKIPWREVIPPLETWQPGSGAAAVNPSVAKALMKLDLINKKYSEIRFYHSATRDGLLFASISAKAIGLVMPLRDSKLDLNKEFACLGIHAPALELAEAGEPA